MSTIDNSYACIVSSINKYIEDHQNSENIDETDKIKTLKYKLTDVETHMKRIFDIFEEINCELLSDVNNLHKVEQKQLNEYQFDKKMWNTFLPYMMIYQNMQDHNNEK